MDEFSGTVPECFPVEECYKASAERHWFFILCGRMPIFIWDILPGKR